MKSVSPNALLRKRRGSAKAWARWGWVRWKAVSKQAICGICGAASRIARSARGCAADAKARAG